MRASMYCPASITANSSAWKPRCLTAATTTVLEEWRVPLDVSLEWPLAEKASYHI